MVTSIEYILNTYTYVHVLISNIIQNKTQEKCGGCSATPAVVVIQSCLSLIFMSVSPQVLYYFWYRFDVIIIKHLPWYGQYGGVALLQKKKVLRFAQYLKLPIDAYQVYTIFEFTEVYLIHPAKEIFRKFPKMAFLKNVLILPLDIYLLEFTQLTKTCVLCQH